MSNQDLSTDALVKKAFAEIQRLTEERTVIAQIPAHHGDTDVLLWDAITRLLQERDEARAEVVKIRRLLELMGIDIDAVPEPSYKPGDAVIYLAEKGDRSAVISRPIGYNSPILGWEYIIRYPSGTETRVYGEYLRPADSPAPDEGIEGSLE